MKMCLNWKVAAALAAVGVAVWVFAPGLVAGLLPLLAVAVCPLSMLLMMKGMSSIGSQSSSCSGATTAQRQRSEGSDREVRVLEAEKAQLVAELKQLRPAGRREPASGA